MPIKLYGIEQFADELNQLDNRWNRNKIISYYQNGKLPEPYAIAGNVPFWTKEQVKFFKNLISQIKNI